ncbi:MAG: endolytic transglycosylase MltG [Candidatus Taylorbacteria bacterium]|nr:endolytic transglycosylase MltG [Candidatus Taylorbacteria bacterium]
MRSRLLFRVYATLLDGSTGVKTGDYLFTKPESALRVASRLVKGELGFSLVKVTIPEGKNSRDIALLIAKTIPSFSKDEFLKISKQHEGYLFPETYFWPTNVTPEQVVRDLKAQFDAKALTIKTDVDKYGKPIGDVMKMASIVEREATSSTDRRIVAGVLWKRLADGMALQVDPPFEYFLNKTSDKLTLEDLKIDSPYNLYIHTGLPPTPINNPGLEAILDTLNPTKTAYWYYLSGKDGTMHYAKTLDGRLANKYKYLD